ncbi:MAG: hypothetical protein ABW133_03375 [Polyangiaceae bacterium]
MPRRSSPRVRPSPISRLVRAIIATTSLVVCAATAGAQTPLLMPVYLQQAGPKAIQVEVAAGRVGPCDSSYNVPLFRGWVDPGRTLRLSTPYGCVCYRHTYDDFPQVNWSPSTVTCRRICTVQGGYGLCPADPNDALFISVRSSAH